MVHLKYLKSQYILCFDIRKQCTLGEIHFSLHSPDEKNTELKKILTKIHLFPLDYFYSNIGTKL